MYVPAAFAETRVDVLHQFIAKHSFATLISGGGGGGAGGGELAVSHVPMVLIPGRGPLGTLQVHVARQNDHGRVLAAGGAALAIFHGPHAYVSPRWYRNPVSVPTWNYVVVHARGTPRVMDDEALRAHLQVLVAKYEPPHDAGGWNAAAALPADVLDKLRAQVAGFEIELTRLEGKWKLGQNRTTEDREGAIDGLRQSGDGYARTLADWMAAALRR